MEIRLGVQCELSDYGELNLTSVFQGINLHQYNLFSYSMLSEGSKIITNNGSCVTPESLMSISDSKCAIWELSMYVFPKCSLPRQITDYIDYLNSECICCLLYYDCKYLEVYAKSQEWITIIADNLSHMKYNELSSITSDNDVRNYFY